MEQPDSQRITDIANPGERVGFQMVKSLRADVARLLGRNQYSFPGAQPVSFSRAHLDDLRRKE